MFSSSSSNLLRLIVFYIACTCLIATKPSLAKSLQSNSQPKPIPKKILVAGDSLSAGYGLNPKEGWVYLMQQRLTRLEPDAWEIINASISGETSGEGARKLPKLIEKHQPTLVVLGLGANDGLRGLSVNLMRNNLRTIIEAAHHNNAKVALLGIMLPPNYGPFYTEQFSAAFKQLAEQYKLPFVPFMLEPVATNLELMQEDELHPNAQAQPLILDHIWPTIAQTLGLELKTLDLGTDADTDNIAQSNKR